MIIIRATKQDGTPLHINAHAYTPGPESVGGRFWDLMTDRPYDQWDRDYAVKTIMHFYRWWKDKDIVFRLLNDWCEEIGMVYHPKVERDLVVYIKGREVNYIKGE